MIDIRLLEDLDLLHKTYCKGHNLLNTSKAEI